MVGERDATLMGLTSHCRGERGLEEREAGLAHTGGRADGVGGVVGKAARKKF